MEAEALRLVLLSIKHVTHVYGQPTKITKYGNSIIFVFANGKRYKLGLMELFSSEATLD